jgi:hypothetical protein
MITETATDIANKPNVAMLLSVPNDTRAARLVGR